MALTEKQIEERRSSIGASDAITIMWGDSDAWRSLYNEKVNGVRPVFPQNRLDLMEMGNAMEPLTLSWFAREHHAIRKLPAGYRVTWKTDPFFTFTPDAITLDDGLPVQAKYHTGDKSIIDLADYYGVQLLHEMLCMGVKQAFLAVTFGHYGRRQHLPVVQDEVAVEAYLQRAMAFKEYVKTGVAPDWMAAPVNLNIPRRRDHVWDVGDNEIASLSLSVIENAQAKERFEADLLELKARVPDDAQTATWVGSDGIGVKFKVARNNAKRWEIVRPSAPLAARPVSVAKKQRSAPA